MKKYLVIGNPIEHSLSPKLHNYWLKKNKIVGITGLDTRSLTNLIRDKGAPKGTIAHAKNGKFNISRMTIPMYIDIITDQNISGLVSYNLGPG